MFPSDEQTVEFFLEAYRQGAFPMAEPSRPARAGRRASAPSIDWYIPDPRAIIELNTGPRPPEPHDLGGFHISRSLARRLRSGRFTITTDRAFEQVIRACAEPARGRDDTWLDERLIRAYTALHRAGHAHSIEVWLPAASPDASPALVGGVYGVALGAAFCAESMFCRPRMGGTDASKVALAHLVRHLRLRGFVLLDVQIRNHHTDQFGVVEIPAAVYLDRLHVAMARPVSWGELAAGPFFAACQARSGVAADAPAEGRGRGG